jgi:hypothetical protein
VTLTLLPAIDSVAVRVPKLFGDAKTVMFADPLPLAGLEDVIHGDVDVTVHGEQVEGNVKVIVRSPPAESNVSD